MFLNRIFIAGSGVSLLFMLVVACLNMILRPLYLPIKGSYELIGISGALTAALILVQSQLESVHITVDIVSSRYPKKLRKIIGKISSLLGTALFAFLGVELILLSIHFFRMGEKTETLRLILYPFVFVVGISSGLMSIAFLVKIFDEKRG